MSRGHGNARRGWVLYAFYAWSLSPGLSTLMHACSRYRPGIGMLQKVLIGIPFPWPGRYRLPDDLKTLATCLDRPRSTIYVQSRRRWQYKPGGGSDELPRARVCARVGPYARPAMGAVRRMRILRGRWVSMSRFTMGA